MASNYYTNPFDNADDATCFADVDLVEVSMEELHEREEMLPTLQLTSRPSHGNSVAQTIEIQDENYYGRDSLASFQSAEVFPCADTANEVSLSSVRVLSNKKNNTAGSPKTDRWKLEELHQKLGELQRSMNEMTSSKRVMEGDYESYMKSLKEKLDSSIEEKNELLSTTAKLESDIRCLRAEKDDLAFLYRQEKERNGILSQQVTQLELELNLAHENHQKMMHELQQSHQEELSRSARLTSPHGSDLVGGSSIRSGSHTGVGLFSTFSTARGSHHLDHWTEVDSHSSFQEKSEVAAATAAAPLLTSASSSLPPEQKVSSAMKSSSAPEVRARGKGNPNVSSWTFGNSEEVSRRPEQKTEKEKNECLQERLEEIETLDAELVLRSKTREMLSAQLTQLDKSKVRSAVDRQKKAAVERDLEEEEKAIGRIRLKLRGLQAFAR